VTDFVGHLEAKDLAPKTVHNVIATLRAMLNYAKAPQRRWVLTNAVDGVELPAVPEPQEIRYLTLPEIQRLLDHVRPGMFHEIDHGLYHAAVTTGMRLGELGCAGATSTGTPAASASAATTPAASSAPPRPAAPPARSR
jgi:integrase